MRGTPTEIATTAGNPFGTAATARLTEVRNNSGRGLLRGNPSPKDIATLPDVARTRMCPNELSFRCSGVPLSACASHPVAANGLSE
jgi:hypothetical protein